MLGTKKLLAWYRLTKLGSVKHLRNEITIFYRGNIIRVLKEESWFDFLKERHTLEEIAENFGYTDKELLQEILEVLVRDQTLLQTTDQEYLLNEPLDESWVAPSLLHQSLQNASIKDAEFLPKRLKGNFLEFSAETKLFNWEDAFRAETVRGRLYNQIRECAFAFTGLPKPGTLLNVGCGAGYETAHIWWKYFTKGLIKEPLEIYAVDPETAFINIALAEFVDMLVDVSNITTKPASFFRPFEKTFPDTGFPEIIANISTNPKAFFQAYEAYFPTFAVADVIDLNQFKDETFDIIFLSQVFHWTDTEKALQELFRVTKPGGVIFGTNSFFPHADPYSNLHLRVIEGATGYIHEEKFKELCSRFGASKIALATPIAVFWMIKK